ncbi:MAG: hypothetical protein H6Q76_2039 [Firmicutes bacterium]|nr:hypothetical protein [Bacillota bacterium]
MLSTTNYLANLPRDSVRDRFDNLNSKFLRRQIKTPLDEYSLSVINSEDWIIQEQPEKMLPRSLTDLISLQLRDEGNALIEATRELNNRYVGITIRKVQALLVADLDLIDLRQQLLVWAEAVKNAVLYKMRRQASENPYELFTKLYNSFVSDIDNTIAHGNTHMYSRAWTPVMDAIPFWLMDALFIQTGLVTLTHDLDKLHASYLKGKLLLDPHAARELPRYFNLYGIEPSAYVTEIVLRPLSKVILSEPILPQEAEMQRQVDLYLSDLLEAFPYLLESKRGARHIFSIPGTTCVASFSFLSNHGFARICFGDSHESLVRGIETAYVRGLVEIGYFGQITYTMHPWMSLQRVFGRHTSLALTYWLLKQVHPLVVADYLKIRDYYLDRRNNISPDASEEYVGSEQSATYVPWIEEAQRNSLGNEVTDSDVNRSEAGEELLPQMRRSRFFKLLSLCGVEVAQGKGSEIKLLKANAHPFRLGNHYGPNPTIPSFLINNILKRLEITPQEWRAAVASTRAGLV